MMNIKEFIYKAYKYLFTFEDCFLKQTAILIYHMIIIGITIAILLANQQEPVFNGLFEIYVGFSVMLFSLMFVYISSEKLDGFFWILDTLLYISAFLMLLKIDYNLMATVGTLTGFCFSLILAEKIWEFILKEDFKEYLRKKLGVKK